MRIHALVQRYRAQANSLQLLQELARRAPAETVVEHAWAGPDRHCSEPRYLGPKMSTR